MKLSWSMLAHPEDFWVQVLRSQYKVNALSVPFVSSTNRDSPLWKGISKVWHHLKNSLYWILGDGSIARFWQDPFIPGVGPLLSQSSQGLPVWQINLPVASFVLNNELNWNMMSSLN
ncbi:putative ribonuclease H protein [Sesbania bispinosa]|nr:putative ribonuclease H protein [Sesbania bispinosa]